MLDPCPCHTQPPASSQPPYPATAAINHCRYSLVADAAECFTKKHAQVLVATYFEARIKGTSVTGGPKLVDLVIHLKMHVPRWMEAEDISHKPNGSEMSTTMTNLVGSNLTTIEQLNTNVSGYYAQFEEMKLRCAVREELWVTVTRFINGLRYDLKGEVSLHHLEYSMEAYPKALEIEKYKKPSYSRLSHHRWVSQAEESKPSKSITFQKTFYPKEQSQDSQFAKSNVQFSQPLSSAKEQFPPFTPILPSPSLFSMVCHKFHEQGHPASRCPNRTLIIGLDTLEDDDQIDETIYPATGDTASESEHEDDERESHLTVSLLGSYASALAGSYKVVQGMHHAD
ncbi:hypothetical protein Cgig2_019526 [Carnegiea gigantea]|uniref:Uncharacterized protein n=1 Tax=Carnegiea gigantea TaxID=171969 RepID=A0A9Q1KHI4_9CARY|nr:hypothetical protein Cgig2_019526 [Carnegiea gigantea]